MLDAVGSSSFVGRDDAAQADEARRRAEEAARRAAEEARRRAEEARRRAEEAKRQAEAARKAAEEAEAKAQQTQAQADKDKAATLKSDHKAKQEAALKAEAQAVLKEKEHGLAKSKLKDVQDNRAPSAPSATTQDAQAQVDKAKTTAAFYEPPAKSNNVVPLLNGSGPLLATPALDNSQPLSTWAKPVQAAPVHDVDGYARQIQDVYDQSGAAAAAQQLALAEGDASLSPEQRKQLMAKAQPVVDKIAETAGKDARRTDLPADGQAGKTNGIDDQAEYRGLVGDLASATQAAGDPAQTRHIAEVILSNTAKSSSGGGRADTLDLLGAGLSALPTDKAALRDMVMLSLNADAPANATASSVLGESAESRALTAAYLSSPDGLTGPGVGDASDPDIAAAYTRFTVEQAQASKILADQLQAKLGKTSPEDDPAGWEMYTARRKVANQDQAKAEQAVAAELRLTYKADPNNKGATENAAHGIADRYRNDPLMQKAVASAQQTVFNESPAQRATNTQLNEVNRKAATLDDLTGRQREGDKSVTGEQIQAARKQYEAAQQGLLGNVKTELDETYKNLPDGLMIRSDDPLADAARQVASRYGDDPELTVVVQAATDIHRINDTAVLGNEAQLDKLGQVLPKGVDPSVKRLVMGDAGVKQVVDTYVTNAAGKVDETYRTKGTVAGAEALRDLTDPAKHAGVTPQIAAQIINKSQPTVAKIVDDIHQLSPKGKDGRLTGTDIQAGIKVADALSQAVDVAAGGSDVVNKQYDSPEIQKAIQDTAHLIATKPAADITMFGFKDAVGNGYATLALQTAAEIKTMKLDDVDMGQLGKPDEDQRKVWEDVTLRAISQGLDQLQDKVDHTSEETMKGMAPLLAQGKHAPNLTEKQFLDGQRKMTAEDKDLASAVKKGYEDFDQLGYRLVRTGEAVEFYAKDLGDLKGYKEVTDGRNELMADEKSTTIMLSSNSASRRMATQVVRTMLSDDLKNGGLDAQTYGIGAQAAGDLTEFLAETYYIKGVNPMGPEGKAVNLPGAEIDVSRSAHIPYFGGAAIWGVGGGLQAALTSYLFNNVHIGGEFGPLRKGILLGLVGGFAAFHLMQAGMAAARIAPHSFGQGTNAFSRGANAAADWMDTQIGKLGSKFFQAAESGENSWGLYVKEGSARDRWTRLAVEATPGLVKQLVGLMTIATVWDLSGVIFNAAELDGNKRDVFKLVTQGTNLVSDSVLLRLQVREMVLRSIGKEALKDPAFATAFEQLGLRGAGAQAFKDGANSGWRALGNSKFLNWFEGIFTKEGTKEMLANSFKRYFFKEAIGEGGKSVLKFAVLGDNPIGWAVNILYMATTIGNWAYDHNKNINNFERYDRTFMEGAGLDKAHADVMDQHHWWSGDAKVDGFLKAYEAQGGDPTKFIDFINHTDTKTLDAMIGVSEHMDDKLDKDGKVPITQEDQSFLALPLDPTKTDVSKYTVIGYNGQSKRYEDPVTQTYWQGGRWFYDPKIGNMMGYTPARKDGLVFYDPATMSNTYSSGGSGFTRPIELTSNAGWENFMRANGMPLPPKAPPPITPPNAGDYLSLPADPSKVDLKKETRFSYDEGDKRYHDQTTHMAFADGKWYFDPKAAGADGNPYGTVSYDPSTRVLYAKGDKQVQLDPKDSNEFDRWVAATNAAGGAPTDSGDSALPAAPDVPAGANVYVVKKGDFIEKIAGYDPDVKAQIYALNPWLNDRMEGRDPNDLPGQDPDIIHPGDPLILPSGYKPPAG